MAGLEGRPAYLGPAGRPGLQLVVSSPRQVPSWMGKLAGDSRPATLQNGHSSQGHAHPQPRPPGRAGPQFMFPTLPRVLLSRRPNSPLLCALSATWAWCHRALQLGRPAGERGQVPLECLAGRGAWRPALAAGSPPRSACSDRVPPRPGNSRFWSCLYVAGCGGRQE